MEVRRLLLVTHPAERMFDLIEGAEHYPAFLPWCASATVTERSDEIVAADIRVDWHGVRFDFATRNLKRRPRWMGVHLAQGPFREFEGEWQLTPLGEEGCRVAFLLRYDFDNPLLRRVAGHVFERITNTLVDAFVARADSLGAAIPSPQAVMPGRFDTTSPAMAQVGDPSVDSVPGAEAANEGPIARTDALSPISPAPTTPNPTPRSPDE
jgi:ribosome-associated toxin RatA of RatAB toxin-antitoxin module